MQFNRIKSSQTTKATQCYYSQFEWKAWIGIEGTSIETGPSEPNYLGRARSIVKYLKLGLDNKCGGGNRINGKNISLWLVQVDIDFRYHYNNYSVSSNQPWPMIARPKRPCNNWMRKSSDHIFGARLSWKLMMLLGQRDLVVPFKRGLVISLEGS